MDERQIKIHWHITHLISSFDDIDINKLYISASNLLHIINFLLIIRYCLILYCSINNDPENTKDNLNDNGIATGIEEMINPLNSTSFIPYLKTFLKKDFYNKFKKNSFSILRAINPIIRSNDIKYLNEKRFNIDYTKFQTSLNLTIPFLFEDSLNYLLNPLLYNLDENIKIKENISIVCERISNLNKMLDDQNFNIITPQLLTQLSTFLKLNFKSGNDNDNYNNNSNSNLNVNEKISLNSLKSLYVGSSNKNNKFEKFNEKFPRLNNHDHYHYHRHYNNNDINGKHYNYHYQDAKDDDNNNKKIYGEKLIYGVYIKTPWRKTNKDYFGNKDNTIFQLSSQQNIFKCNLISRDNNNNNSGYGYDNTANADSKLGYFNTLGGGIGFGNEQPVIKNNDLVKYRPGSVSLTIDSSLEFCVFRHLNHSEVYKTGSVYKSFVDDAKSEESKLESSTEIPMDIPGEIPIYEDRFAISEMEVWGIGGEDALREQQKQWAWEENESRRRRSVNLKNLGEERAFLEMAGLVGRYSSSGGSM
ncbi:Rtc5p ASCRUDRAFT_134048 [Ascoidea rubescens DSM 1968]|uniref:TLDc domain-containing protein n=1 Tax=Ascoidea rubescens DSM 1968 TaxID=1344418 RepID=A0A1D2VL31_9ASCO|nr:hypothetical protein ASCRUDRAFT_134048 [Ascoidea rubescens DSM 1968]ODV62305.1 hypothetical protein ASCRUDRAFT_134048 [Ascoidea rubescens DSM 1968]